MKHRDHRSSRSNNGVVSNCGDIRVRGSITAIIEKYNVLASESRDSSEREMYLQHAEHYTRVQNERTQHE